MAILGDLHAHQRRDQETAQEEENGDAESAGHDVVQAGVRQEDERHAQRAKPVE